MPHPCSPSVLFSNSSLKLHCTFLVSGGIQIEFNYLIGITKSQAIIRIYAIFKLVMGQFQNIYKSIFFNQHFSYLLPFPC